MEWIDNYASFVQDFRGFIDLVIAATINPQNSSMKLCEAKVLYGILY